MRKKNRKARLHFLFLSGTSLDHDSSSSRGAVCATLLYSYRCYELKMVLVTRLLTCGLPPLNAVQAKPVPDPVTRVTRVKYIAPASCSSRGVTCEARRPRRCSLQGHPVGCPCAFIGMTSCVCVCVCVCVCLCHFLLSTRPAKRARAASQTSLLSKGLQLPCGP